MTTLFDPLLMGDIQLKNRMALAPMTRGRAGDSRVPNEMMADYYHQRASAGLIITEATVVSKQGIGWIGSPGIYSDEMKNGWKVVTDRIKESGTPIFLQLWHCGRASHSDFHNGEPPVSASGVKLEGIGIHTPKGKKSHETPRALSIPEIHKIAEDYGMAAKRAKAAGFSGVEVHAANGYLINQFLDSKTNLRNDTYGGSVEKKYRFLDEVLEAVMEAFPAHRVGVRISPNGIFNDMGSEDFRETYLYVAKELDKRQLGYLHIMDGLAFGFHEKGEPVTLDEFRQVYSGLIMGNCGYTKESAEQRLADSTADLAAFGRPWISNPDLVERFQNNLPLNPFDDMTYWYTSGAEGYTDYRKYETETVHP